jgi:2-methylisocitrate lyase-like PEP mutase family enzyme
LEQEVNVSIPPEVVARANAQSRRLRELVRAPAILVMPGAYDTLSALFFEALGFLAVQGSSGGVAAANGVQDGEILPRDEFTEIYRRMARVVRIPVNADGVKGYGGPDQVAETVRGLIGAGIAGMNLEDSDYRRPGEAMRLVSVSDQLAKIRSLVATRRAQGSEFFLNARVDAFLVGGEGPALLGEAIERGNAYAETGADCIFYVNAGDAQQIATLVREVNAPVSILADATSPPVQALEDLGVARVSYGTAFPRIALGALKRFSDVLLAKGDPSPYLREALSSRETNALLADHWIF